MGYSNGTGRRSSPLYPAQFEQPGQIVLLTSHIFHIQLTLSRAFQWRNCNSGTDFEPVSRSSSVPIFRQLTF